MVKFNVNDFTSEINIKDRGVYMITHSSTDIKYIGSTINSFYLRWKAHIGGLYRGVGNRVLINIYNKYGISGFRFSILESMNNSTEKEIRARERYYIEKYDTYKNGANCTLETECSFISYDRVPHSEEQKMTYLLTSPTKKKTYLYDIDGNLLYIFPSSCSCDRFLGLRKGRTNWAINHPLKSLRGKYYPSYEEKEWNPKEEKLKIKREKFEKIAKLRKEKGSYIMTDAYKDKIRMGNPNRKQVALYDLENNLIKVFDSLNECDDYLGLYRGSTSKVFRGICKTLKKKYIPKLI